jgi:hypothetical protein
MGRCRRGTGSDSGYRPPAQKPFLLSAGLFAYADQQHVLEADESLSKVGGND